MPIPSSYTEEQLKAYMHSLLGDSAAILGWTVTDGNYEEAVTDTLLLYGVQDIADGTDIGKLRKLARVAVWRAVLNAVGLRFNFSSDGASFQLVTLSDSAIRALRMAEESASEYLGEFSINHIGVTYPDPYSFLGNGNSEEY